MLNLANGSVADGRTLAGDPHALFEGNGLAFPDAITFSYSKVAGTSTLAVPYDGTAAYAVRGRVLAVSDHTSLTTEPTGPHQARVAVWDGGTGKGA